MRMFVTRAAQTGDVPRPFSGPADLGGSLNVSLFDVADADKPNMLARVPFAVPNLSEDYAILDSATAEDQDR